MSSLLELILIIIALYIFLRLFVLYLAPWLLKYYISRFQRKFFEQNQGTPPDTKTKEGKVTIQRMKESKDNDIPKDLGDYIDYEEINNHQKPTDE